MGYGELKSRLRGPEVVLRWRSPQLVRQEVFGFLVVYRGFLTPFDCRVGVVPGSGQGR
jgi:hypothetical protein